MRRKPLWLSPRLAKINKILQYIANVERIHIYAPGCMYLWSGYFLCSCSCLASDRKYNFDKCNSTTRSSTMAIDNAFQIGQPEPRPTPAHRPPPTIRVPALSLATSSVLQLKHLRCFYLFADRFAFNRSLLCL